MVVPPPPSRQVTGRTDGGSGGRQGRAGRREQAPYDGPVARFQRPIRLLASLPAPIRWFAPPLGLLACSAFLLVGGGGWQPPVTAPQPDAKVAGYCQALAKALPASIEGRDRAGSSSPYVALWKSSTRTVLRCGVPRPASLNSLANQESTGPNVNDVQWYMEQDGHGGYRFTCTLRLAYVEVSVPTNAFPNFIDPLSSISDAVKATIPDLSGQLGGSDDGSS